MWRLQPIEFMAREGPRHDDLPNTGKYRDGFGNRIDVRAVANPPARRNAKTRLELGRQKSSGFGVVRVDKAKGTFTLEAWPVDVEPASDGAAPYAGWPVTVSQADCAGASNPTLPPVVLEGWPDEVFPVVQVRDASGEVVSTVRMKGPRLAPRVYDPQGEYTVRLLLPEADGPEGRVLKTFEKVSPGSGGALVWRS